MSNAFDGKSGLVMDSQTFNPREQEARDRQALEERIDRMRFDAAKERHDRKEADLKAQVETATEVSLRANQQLAAQRMGINGGQALTAGQQMAAQEASGDAFMVAPRALIDQLPVTIGGIQLGPKQAQDMLARGEIRRADYVAAVNKALAPYGQSFR